MRKFLLEQYEATGGFPLNHNYLQQQFADYKDIFAKLEKLVQEGDFTLGAAVHEFEDRIAAMLGAKYCIGMGSGTDALMLSLKALGVGEGDEVITTPYTFFATVGAIVTAGAKPVFADVGDDLNLDPAEVAGKITARTRAILPVHWSGQPCDMDGLQKLGLPLIEDACHALGAAYKGKSAGTFGYTGCFSLHPLKNLNVWGDGGFLVTDDDEAREKLLLLRNHGLLNRNECAVFAYNSRLDSLQAVVASHLLDKLPHINETRIANSQTLDRLLADLPQVTIPRRTPETRHVYHLYCIRVERRDELLAWLQERGIDAKVHYPIPMHLQPAARFLGHAPGDFPRAEAVCASVLSLPVHEFLTAEDMELMAGQVRTFYATGE